MTGVDDLVFVIAAYGGILGAVAVYAVTLTPSAATRAGGGGRARGAVQDPS